ncbi:MAG TPA: hypothetical protein VJQ26_01885 [Ktedonobacteraceae bacterium]|nr:hypothetical protein [Ktedonobacteraceae bacterium]
MVRLEENSHPEDSGISIERVQIGVRMEKKMVKVLKALAEYFDITLGDLLEGITLHAFESKTPFSEETLRRIAQLKEVYGMDYDVSASHRFTEYVLSTDQKKHREEGHR